MFRAYDPDRERLVDFSGQFGMPAFLLRPPKPHRPDVWHVDMFSWVLDRLIEVYPVPPEVEAASPANPE